MRLLFLGMFFLAGCGVPDNDNHGYGYAFDEAATDGLRVRYANDNPPRLTTLDKIYSDVAICMGTTSPPGPLVIFVDDLTARVGNYAKTFLDTGTVLIDSQITTLNWSGNPFPPPVFPIKHEMVHYILDRLGFPRDQNANHESVFFDSCIGQG